MSIDARTPVLVGVGTAHRPVDGSAGVEAVDLMVEAVHAASADAAAPHLAGRAQMVAVPEGNWSYPDPARLVADRIGATAAHTVRVDIGVPQETPIGAALDRIRTGALDVAVVVGGEAMASRLRVQRAGGTPDETPQSDGSPDERWTPQGEFIADAEVRAGIWAPVEQYACIDNALRHAEGRTVDEHLDEIAALWSAMNAVAATNPLADFATPRAASFLRAAGPDNRPLAFPYAKWHSTQWSVDQAGALLLCSADAARTAGVPLDRWVFAHVAVESSHSLSLTRRADMHRWPAMRLLGDAAEEQIGRPLAQVDHIECYSCFPAAVRVQQRELRLPIDGVPTVTGGMAFAGGPFNNFTYQATAAVVPRLREVPGAFGLITTVSGLLSKPGLAVWAATPPAGGALIADFAEEARAATPAREVTAAGSGPATVATYTVTYDGDDAVKAFVVADLEDGRRWIGTSHHPELLARGTTEELIGSTVVVHGAECTPA
jgi:acetyl-CoA C-acetyltransferase